MPDLRETDGLAERVEHSALRTRKDADFTCVWSQSHVRPHDAHARVHIAKVRLPLLEAGLISSREAIRRLQAKVPTRFELTAMCRNLPSSSRVREAQFDRWAR